LRLPRGLRTASTMTTSRMLGNLSERPAAMTRGVVGYAGGAGAPVWDRRGLSLGPFVWIERTREAHRAGKGLWLESGRRCATTVRDRHGRSQCEIGLGVASSRLCPVFSGPRHVGASPLSARCPWRGPSSVSLRSRSVRSARCGLLAGRPESLRHLVFGLVAPIRDPLTPAGVGPTRVVLYLRDEQQDIGWSLRGGFDWRSSLFDLPLVAEGR